MKSAITAHEFVELGMEGLKRWAYENCKTGLYQCLNMHQANPETFSEEQVIRYALFHYIEASEDINEKYFDLLNAQPMPICLKETP